MVVAQLILVRSMRRTHRDRIEPLILIVIVVALFIAAFFSYKRPEVTDFSVYTPFRPSWLPVVTFVLIGVLVRLGYLAAGRSRHKKDADGNASRKT